jgi:hypothetical protein
MPIRITYQAKWPERLLPFDIQRLVTPGGGFPEASSKGRSKETRTLCGYI